jgi:hypothetical protein
VSESVAAAVLVNETIHNFDSPLAQPEVAEVSKPFHFSEAASRRSRCGSVRGRPVLSSHFSPDLAPHVGQRTASASFCVIFMLTQCTVIRHQAGQF